MTVSRARIRPATWSHRTHPLTRVSEVQRTLRSSSATPQAALAVV